MESEQLKSEMNHNNDRNIYNNVNLDNVTITIMSKVHYRLSNGAGSKKEILVCGLFLSMQGAMNDDKRECIVPSVALLASN